MIWFESALLGGPNISLPGWIFTGVQHRALGSALGRQALGMGQGSTL